MKPTLWIATACAALWSATPAYALCAAPKTMDGTWKANDGGTYYVRQVGNQVWWFGESKKNGFSNVFRGNRSGNTVTGMWADIKGGTGSGTLTFVISGTNSVGGWKKQSATGGFGGSIWFKGCDDTGQNPVD